APPRPHRGGPRRRRAPAPPLLAQLAQDAPPQLGRGALGPAAGAHELEEQRLDIVVLPARRALVEVRAELPLELGGELPVEVVVEMLGALPAVHGLLPLI